MTKRLSWEQYALRLAQTAAMRSEDPFLQVGAVALRPDHSIGGIGYNGAPKGVDIDWTSRDSRRPYVVHAEVNALRYCAPNACYLLVTTLMPCPNCLTTAAAHGIKIIKYQNKLLEPALSLEMAKNFGITMTMIAPNMETQEIRLSQEPF